MPIKLTSLLTLGEIGKNGVNLYSESQVFDTLLKIIDNENEKQSDVKLFASISLGGVSLGNIEKSMTQIF